MALKRYDEAETAINTAVLLSPQNETFRKNKDKIESVVKKFRPEDDIELPEDDIELSKDDIELPEDDDDGQIYKEKKRIEQKSSASKGIPKKILGTILGIILLAGIFLFIYPMVIQGNGNSLESDSKYSQPYSPLIQNTQSTNPGDMSGSFENPISTDNSESFVTSIDNNQEMSKFLNEVEYSESTLSSSISNAFDSAGERNFDKTIEAMSKVNSDVREAELRIDRISGVDEALIKQFADSLNLIEEGSSTYINAKWDELSTSEGYQIGVNSRELMMSGMTGIKGLKMILSKYDGSHTSGTSYPTSEYSETNYNPVQSGGFVTNLPYENTDSSSKSSEKTFSGIKQTVSNIVLDGQIFGDASPLTELSFYIKVPDGGETVNTDDISFLFGKNNEIPIPATPLAIEKSLRPGERTKVDLQVNGPEAGGSFTLEIQSKTGASTLISRTLSNGFNGGMII
jgi:hypothetical protein